MTRLYWIPIGALLLGLFWFVWVDGKRQPGSYLFASPDAGVEAGYCLAVAERARELTKGQGEARLEAFLTENIDFWRTRVASAASAGRAALGADLAAAAEPEQVHLHLSLQDCGRRAVVAYGWKFKSIDSG